MKNQKVLFSLLVVVSMLIIGCENSKELFNPIEPERARSSASGADQLVSSATGAVYTMTNDPTENEVVAFQRNLDGTLSLIGYYSTKGAGSGGEIDPLGSQGSIVLSSNGIASAHRYLFAVNAGSNEISSFEVQGGKLELRDKVDAGGVFPVSISVHGDLLYVLNAGVADGIGTTYETNITGFRVASDGRLKRIPQSTRSLSEREQIGPAQVQFGPNGKLLIITEKAANGIDVFMVREDGLTSGPIRQHSVGETPFGFAFTGDGQLVISEAFGGRPGASAASLYEIGLDGGLQVVSPSVRTGQTAGCWTVATNDGRYAYVSNTLSHTISGFYIEEGGLKLIQEVAHKSETENHPIDMALSQDSRFLYVLNAGQGSIGAFQIQKDGRLVSLVNVDGTGVLPAFAGIQGLAAY